jgi:hypothetical protein
MALEKLTARKFSPKVKVEVTAERIADSCQRSSAHCMIAEALRDVLPATMKRIEVSLYYANFTDTERNLRYSYHLPRNAQLALIDFDRGIVPQPFGVELRHAEKITRRRPYGSVKANLPHGGETAEYKAERRRGKRRNQRSDRAVIAAMNDPNAPLHGPAILSETFGSASTATVVGGELLPAAVNNFARNRRFGLRMLVE